MKNILPTIKNIATICGLNVPAENGNDSMESLRELIQRDTKSAMSLSGYLTYRYCDDALGLFFNENDVVGFMIQICPIVGSDRDLEKNLNLFFNDELIEDAHLQFLLVASHDIENKLDLWRSERDKSGNEMIELITSYREEFLREKAKDFTINDGRMSRDFKIYVSFSKDYVSCEKELQKIISFKTKLFKKLQALKLNPRICKGEDLISITREIMQMTLKPTSTPKYNKLNLLSKQILKPLTRTRIESDKIEHIDEGLVSKCFYPLTTPEEFSLFEMIELLGSSNEGAGIAARFVISYAISTDIDKRASAKILQRGHRAIHASEQSYTRHDKNLKEEAAEWKEVIARTKNGERFLTDSMQVMITTLADELASAEENLRSLYNSKDWQLEVNKNLQLPAMLSMLPMQQASYFGWMKKFQLYKVAMSREVVAKLPIHGEWKGVPKSGVLMIGRRGELFNWNPFYRVGGGGNFNICVMAPAGSGKSVFLQELATSMLAQDVAVFILDIGRSYQNICDLIGGESIRFSNDGDLSLNPFATLANSGAELMKALQLLKMGKTQEEVQIITGLMKEQIEALNWDKSQSGSEEEEKIEILQIGEYFVTKDSIIYGKSIVAAMCGVKGNAHMEAIIEKAITSGIEQYGTSLDITKLAKVLEQDTSKEAKDLSETLYPYTEKGIHGRFFKSGRTASFKEMLTLFEFEEVKNDPVLLAVVIQVILMQITMQFLCGDRSRRFLLIVDEAWMIMGFCSSFLEAFARTVRKYGGSLAICVQDIEIFQSGDSQKAIFANSNWRIILKQTSVKGFESSSEFKDYIPLITSISKESHNKYSEVLIQTSGLITVGRLVLDPYSVALYSTEQEDFHFLQKAKSKNMSKEEAVRELSKKYGVLPILDRKNKIGSSQIRRLQEHDA